MEGGEYIKWEAKRGEKMGDTDWTAREWAAWMEDMVRDTIDLDPECIAYECIGKDGKVYTGYWMVSADDRARIMSAMRDDDRMEWLRANREVALEILNEMEDEDEDEDGDEEESEWTTIS